LDLPVRRGKSLVIAVLAVVSLAGCAEEEKPIDVPDDLRQGVLALLRAVDPDADATFSGETCNTDPLADPPDDHRWRLTARYDGTPEQVRAAATGLGWQPERAEDGTLVVVDYHRFGETVDVVFRDGAAVMMVEKDCSTYERGEMDLPAVSVPETTATQGERLGEMVEEVDDTLADLRRELGLRPKEGRYAGDEPHVYSGCAARERSGARWSEYDVLIEEATRDDGLGETADRLVDTAAGWEVVSREDGPDSRGRDAVDLELRSRAHRTTLTVGITFWGEVDGTDGVRVHVTSGRTPCVAVDAE
jgi:hypothetical protein